MNLLFSLSIFESITPESVYNGFTFVAIAVIALGTLILVHEYGHFIVARMTGIRVEKFSIGFGRKIVSWKKGDTDYMLSWIPLGGYVKFYGDDPEEEGIDEKEAFLSQAVWKRLAIVAAGPVFNVVLAVLILSAVGLIGAPTPTRTVGFIDEKGPAYAGGLREGDEIDAINGAMITEWKEMNDALNKNMSAPLTLDVTRKTGEKAIISFTPKQVGRIGVNFDPAKEKPIIAMPQEGKPAKKAGVMIGDTILAIDGKKIVTRKDVIAIVSEAAGKTIAIEILRDSGERFTINVTPEPRPYLGFESNIIKVKHGPFDAVSYGMAETVKMVKLTIYSINLLISREVSHHQIAGPIGIMQMAGTFAKEGLTSLLWFVALISVNLGILNLLPIPILDGGHIIFFSIEALLGRPVKMKIQEFAQHVGLVLLLSLMALAFYNDIMRLIVG